MKRTVILLCLVLPVAFLSGCSDGSSDAPAVNEAHPSNWLSSHGPEANADLRGCQGCHGIDFDGSGDALSCYDCHLTGPPFGTHPLGWDDVQQDHQGFPDNYSWTGCATDDCHGPTLQGGTTGPSCFNDSAQCHVDTTYPPATHPESYTSPSAHGLAGKDDLVYCQNCHGRPLNDFLGGYVAGLLSGAVPEINDNGNCSQCHPDATSHPTNWTRFSNSRDRTHASAGNLATACDICHNLTTDTTPGNNTPGAFPGAPSCFSTDYTNSNGITSNCHPNGPGAFHDVGQDWLSTGHVGPAIANNPDCFGCHTQTAGGGGTDPACQDCHTAGDPLTVTNCTSCHNVPPDSQPPQGDNQPNLQGAHLAHVDFTPTTIDCSACHESGGTGSPSHYDRVDQTTPDYPAEVDFLLIYQAKTGGNTGYNAIDQTCDNISCHGGQTTPDWTAGIINLASDCTSCHQLASVSDQYNSYSSGGHGSHAETNGYADDLGYNPTCSACHDAAELAASGHFDYLDTAVVEGDPVATLLGDLNYDNTTDPDNPTCTNNAAECHGGEIRTWGGAGAPHPTDGTYRSGRAHGSDAKLNLANCQSCHATPPTDGENPKFTVDIIQNKGDEREPSATGCMKCHNTDTAHPSAQGATEDVRWYDSVDGSYITHSNAAGNVEVAIQGTCGLCHPGLGGTGTVGFDCLYCHVTDPAGDAVGTCTSCHNKPPSGNRAPNRQGSHNLGDHKEACSVCHTNDGPDGTSDAARHFTFPTGAQIFGRANLLSAPDIGSTTMKIDFTTNAPNVTCTGQCHDKNHDDNWYR